jgi:lysophospholipase L1-like esterase
MSRRPASHARRLIAALGVVLAAGCSNSPNLRPAPVPGDPALSCPAPITMSGVKTSTVDIVYPKPTLTGGLAPITSSCEPRQGTAFPLGSTVVNCTTTDSQERRAACSFTVTLTRSVLTVQRFLAFGDSITHGTDARGNHLGMNAYPERLRALLEAEFPGQGIVVKNDGLDGEPAGCAAGVTECGERRLPGSLMASGAQVLLLLHGYNDIDDAGPEQVIAALRDMVREARAAGVPYVLVSTLTPGRPYDPGFSERTREAEHIDAVNSALRSFVPTEGAYLVDAFAAFQGREQELVDGDGLHLTAAGYAVLAETFFARIKQVIPVAEQSNAIVALN